MIINPAGKLSIFPAVIVIDEYKKVKMAATAGMNGDGGGGGGGRQWVLTASMVLTGVTRTFVAKILIQLGFNSPFLLTFGMFLGMFCCSLVLIPPLLTSQKLGRVGGKEQVSYSQLSGMETQAGSDEKSEVVGEKLDLLTQASQINIRTAMRIAVPAFCDIIGTGLNFTALLWLPAAINEVLRSGTEMIATALIVVLLNKQVVTRVGWLSIFISSVGLMFVSGGLFVSSGAPMNSNALIGVIITIPRAVVSACQNYADQQLVQALKLAPVLVVAFEGFVGVVVCLFLWPVVQFAGFENVNATAYLLFVERSATYVPIYTVFLLATALSNYFNVSMVAATGALTKEIWRATRPPLIWIFSIAIFYSGGRVVGEQWDGREGYLRILGILFVTAGVVGYSYQANQGMAMKAVETAGAGSVADNDSVTMIEFVPMVRA
jgi:drug/metabolite transporter (DMT)-like permease